MQIVPLDRAAVLVSEWVVRSILTGVGDATLISVERRSYGGIITIKRHELLLDIVGVIT